LRQRHSKAFRQLARKSGKEKKKVLVQVSVPLFVLRVRSGKIRKNAPPSRHTKTGWERRMGFGRKAQILRVEGNKKRTKKQPAYTKETKRARLGL